MDPELMRLAQEHMSRMSPAELARIQQQMMSNPELLKMASESMKNLSSEDFKFAAKQLKGTCPDEMAEIGEKIASASPEEIAAMRARVDAHINYQLNAAEMLKKQGNQLHSQGRFNDAAQTYLLAKENLTSIPSPKASILLMACSLNLMSCYLKTRKYDECIKEGSEVLTYDARNLKALYRRGQAYKELGLLKDAVTDLSWASELSPDDDTIVDTLRDAKQKLIEEGSMPEPRRLIIEGINEEVELMPSGRNMSSHVQQTTELKRDVDRPLENVLMKQPKETDVPSTSNNMNLKANYLESIQALRNDPQAIRSFQNFVSNADPSTFASISGKSGEVSPDMIRAASNMMSKMSPGELQKMLDMTSSFQGQNPFSAGSSRNPGTDIPSIPPSISPDMIKTATDMMNKMSPDELQNVLQIASMKGKNSIPKDSFVNEKGLNSSTTTSSFGAEGFPVINHVGGKSSSSQGVFSNLGATELNVASSAGLQEQMRNQMKDPSMRQMFSSMVKNMNPEMMANMGEQFGIKLSPEDALKAQQAMSSLSPEQLDKMMHWADRIQRGVNTAKKTKNWLLGKPGMLLAVCMLILAVILHRLDFIGG